MRRTRGAQFNQHKPFLTSEKKKGQRMERLGSRLYVLVIRMYTSAVKLGAHVAKCHRKNFCFYKNRFFFMEF